MIIMIMIIEKAKSPNRTVRLRNRREREKAGKGPVKGLYIGNHNCLVN